MTQKVTYEVLLKPLSAKRITAVQKQFYPITWRWSYVAIVLICAVGMSGWLALPLLSTYLHIWILIVTMTLVSFAVIIKLSWSREVSVRLESTVRKIRHEDFARENDLVYIEKTVRPHYNGMVFTSTINTPTAYDQFRWKEVNGIEVGNYRFMADEVSGQEPIGGGYIHMKLDRRVAHMLVSGVGWYQGALSRDFAFEGKQILGLEGDFYQYFSLYAPEGYERDALYIFTPDFMNVLIEQAQYAMDMKGAPISVEIVDDDLYIYSTTFDLTDAQTWKMIIGLASAIGTKTISRTDLYSDEKVEYGQIGAIAKNGRRLKRESPWVLLLSGVIFCAYIAVFMYLIWFLNSRLG